MSRGWLEDALRQTGLHANSTFPRDLIAELIMRLAVTVVTLPGLTTYAVRRWLEDRNIHQRVDQTDRALHGCLVARAGKGIIFLDALDHEDERRFTIAHEIAHFILDHLLPRLKAIKFFGDQILPVLNGNRPPTTEEMLSAALQHVPIGLQVHLMGRGTSGSICIWDIELSEQRADRLALEILAPSRAVRADLDAVTTNDEHDLTRPQRLSRRLARKFGLPLDVAASYGAIFLHERGKKRPLSKEIFGE